MSLRETGLVAATGCSRYVELGRRSVALAMLARLPLGGAANRATGSTSDGLRLSTVVQGEVRAGRGSRSLDLGLSLVAPPRGRRSDHGQRN
jgi:hypothetical protein